jgi:hypothetical protein
MPASRALPSIAIEPLVVRRAEAARMLRLGMTKLKELIRDRKLKETRIGAVSLIHVNSIRELLGIAGDDA